MRKRGQLLGYNGRIPGNPMPSKPKVSEAQSNMTHSLSELPSGKLPKAEYPKKASSK